MTDDFDPFRPILAVICDQSSSDLLRNTIDASGLVVEWPPLDDRSGHTHGTRIRSFRPAIDAAYAALPDEKKGVISQAMVKALWSRSRTQIIGELRDRLADLGWAIRDDGYLVTEDALLSEQFFPPGTEYDAYVAIRSILAAASDSIKLIDPYLGSTLFETLRGIKPTTLSVQLLTTSHSLKPDLALEASKFQAQFQTVKVEIRTKSDFHDRFIFVDDAEIYHLGPSAKDAGKKACLISRLQDAPVIATLKQYFEDAWRGGKPI